MNRLTLATLAVATLLLAPTLAPRSALAQMDHSKMDHGAAPASGDGSTAAYKAASDRMHKGMMIDYSGKADVDFARGMIPHHQGAIDMAKVQLEFGKDPEMRKLAEEIIAAQEKEIAQLKDWLAKNDK